MVMSAPKTIDVSSAMNYAQGLHQAGNHAAAINAYQALLADAPNYADLWFMLGMAQYQHGSKEAALYSTKQAIALQPTEPKYHHQLMQMAELSGDVRGVIDSLVGWLSVSPEDMVASQELINLCLNNHYFEPAIEHLKTILEKDPFNLSMLQVMCLLHVEAKRYHDGLEYFERTFGLHPNQTPEIVKGYAWILYQAGRFGRALQMAQKAAPHLRHDEEIYVLLGSCYVAMSDFDSYLATYHEAVKALPENATLRYSLGIAKMMTSGMREGFEEYEARFASSFCPPRDFAIARWQGEPLAGKKLLIWGEQGVGDVTMFATVLPYLLQQKPTGMVLGLEPKLVALFARTFPGIVCMNYDDPAFTAKQHESDFHVPMGELMRYCVPHYMPSHHAPIYVPKPDLQATLRTRYEAVAKARGATRIIGISWHTKNDLNNMLRNIALSKWAPLFALEKVQFVSLQYGDHAADIAEVQEQFPGALYVDDQVDVFADADAAIAQVAAMDEIITIQNATAHFGGAVGVPTTLLLSAAADWRWGLERADSIWYGSVRVVRQAEALKWDSEMQAQAERLK